MPNRSYSKSTLIQIRIRNTDPDPEGHLNTDPEPKPLFRSGSGSVILTYCTFKPESVPVLYVENYRYTNHSKI